MLQSGLNAQQAADAGGNGGNGGGGGGGPLAHHAHHQHNHHQQQHNHSQHITPPDSTVWMGDLNPDWDASYIREAFGENAKDITNVKMVTTDHGSKVKRATYCFVEFRDEQSAREAMLRVNGYSFPNDPRGRFNLAFANSPHHMSIEYNLFVNNLSPDVDDVALFRLFGEKYRSCRGAKVYRHDDGASKEQGFVRFTSETDQQTALVEMNKQVFHGRELLLKLARPKTRGPGPNRFGGGGRGGGGAGSMMVGGGHSGYQQAGMFVGQMPATMQMVAGVPYVAAGMMPTGAGTAIALATPFGTQLATNHGMAGFGVAGAQQFTGQPIIVSGTAAGYQQNAGFMQPGYPAPQIIHPGQMMGAPMMPGHFHGAPAAHFSPIKAAVPPPVKVPPQPIYEDVEPLSASEANAIAINSSAEFNMAVEASRWSAVTFPPDTRKKELFNLLHTV